MGNATIAIVDQDPTRCANTAEILQRGGYLARPFSRGEDALRVLWDEPVDLLLLDEGLSGISALQLSRELRQRPWGRGLPVVVLGAQEGIAPPGAESEFTAVLSTDTHPADLLKAVFESLVGLCPTLGLLATDLEMPPERPPSAPACRVRTELPRLEVRISSVREFAAEYTHHLSSERLFVRTFSPLPPGEVFDIELSLPCSTGTASLQGRVELCVEVDSAEARLSSPGMRIALLGLTQELRASMASYMAGLRAGASQQPLRGPRAQVLFIGREDRLPAGTASFLRRSSIRALRCEKILQALALMVQRMPDAVVLDLASLEEPPQGAIASLLHTGVATVIALATPLQGADLPRDVAVIDAMLPPSALLEQLSDQLAVARRSSLRVSCAASVRTNSPGGPLGGQVENLSMGGVLMRLPEPFVPGERLHLEFELPEQGGRVRAVAHAVRISRTDDADAALCVAAAFERLEGESAHRLQQFMRRQALENPLPPAPSPAQSAGEGVKDLEPASTPDLQRCSSPTFGR